MEQKARELHDSLKDMKCLDLTIPDSEHLFFVSDLHFFHSKLCTSCPNHFDVCRKYETVDEMNSDMIASWNNTVQKSDTVVFLGDFIMNTPVAQLTECALALWNQLNGNKYFINGNHDKVLRHKLQDTIDFYDYAVIKWQAKTFYAQHRPIGHAEGSNPYLFNYWLSTVNGNPFGTVVVHGHTHSPNKYSKTGRSDFKTQNCVCWDVEYRPMDASRLGTADLSLIGVCNGHQVVAHM